MNNLRGSSLSELNVFRQYFAMCFFILISVYFNVIAIRPDSKIWLSVTALSLDVFIIGKYPILTIYPLIVVFSAVFLLATFKIRDRRLRPAFALIASVIAFGLAGLAPEADPLPLAVQLELVLGENLWIFHLSSIFFSYFLARFSPSFLVLLSLVSVRMIVHDVLAQQGVVNIVVGIFAVAIARKNAQKVLQKPSLDFLSTTLGWVGAFFGVPLFSGAAIVQLAGTLVVGLLVRNMSQRAVDLADMNVIEMERNEIDPLELEERLKHRVVAALSVEAPVHTALKIERVDVGDEDELFAQIAAKLRQSAVSTASSSVA